MLPQPGKETPILSWASIQAELLWVYKGAILPGDHHVEVDHSNGYWVRLLQEGELRISTTEKKWTARKGDWIVSPHRPTIQDFSPDARILSVHFRCQWPTGENLFTGDDAVVFKASEHPALQLSAFKLQRLVAQNFPETRIEFLTKTSDYPVFLSLQRSFYQWLIDFYKVMTAENRKPAHFGNRDGRLVRALECLNESPLGHPLPVKELQRRTSLGRVHLDRLFFREFEITVRNYWEQLRFNSAKRALHATTLPIKQIAHELGFKQPSHFTKWFARHGGFNPQTYREAQMDDFLTRQKEASKREKVKSAMRSKQGSRKRQGASKITRRKVSPL